nr:reverse transcriptase [Tanacetum cinerariifolium]
MNYVPVVVGFQANGIVGTKDNIVAGQAKKKKEPKQEYILIPICTTGPLNSQGPKDSTVDAGKKAIEVDEKEELYVCQLPGFEDLDFPDKVYKVEKALHGLHQASRAWVSSYFKDFTSSYYEENL